jgi:hypothetical protein
MFVALAAVISALAIVSQLPPDQSIFPVLVVGAVAILAFRRCGKTKPFRDELLSARQDWESLRATWNAPAPRPTFKDIRVSLDVLKAQYDALPAERTRRLQKLSDERQKKQMAEHLDRFFIASAKIHGIGRAKVTTLQAHGIDTAGDIHEAKIKRIAGFGDKLAFRLAEWRRECERKFRFDPRRGMAPSDLAALERDITMSRQKLEAEVRTGIGQLKAAAGATIARARLLEGKAAELAPRLSQARANAEALGVKA